jgi:sulfur-carrier protein adenylyltransferase/sulfurtransferase
MTIQEKAYYEKHLILPEIGQQGQQKLKNASVLMVGCGGLGCPVLTYLNAMGVGRIGIIDHDVVSMSNLQRQILFSVDDVGKLKADVAREKLSRQNPFTIIECHPYALDISNAENIIGKYDLVIDGCDNFSTRYLVNDACVVLNKILISGSIERFEGQVSVFNYQQGATYRCLYPEADENMPDCSAAGVVGVLPGIIGMLMATEALKIIAGIGNILAGKLLVYNALNMSFKTYHFEPEPKNRITRLSDSYGSKGCMINDIEFDELQSWIKNNKCFDLIDVRGNAEHEKFNIGGKNIELENLVDHIDHLPTDKPLVLYCQRGVKSKIALKVLQENGFENLYNLKGGIETVG